MSNTEISRKQRKQDSELKRQGLVNQLNQLLISKARVELERKILRQIKFKNFTPSRIKIDIGLAVDNSIREFYTTLKKPAEKSMYDDAVRIWNRDFRSHIQTVVGLRNEIIKSMQEKPIESKSMTENQKNELKKKWNDRYSGLENATTPDIIETEKPVNEIVQPQVDAMLTEAERKV